MCVCVCVCVFRTDYRDDDWASHVLCNASDARWAAWCMVYMEHSVCKTRVIALYCGSARYASQGHSQMISGCVVLCRVVLCCVVLCCVVLCCVVLCCVVLCCVVLCCVVLCCVVLCCVMWCRVVSCRVVLCFVVLCCCVVLHWEILFPRTTGIANPEPPEGPMTALFVFEPSGMSIPTLVGEAGDGRASLIGSSRIGSDGISYGLPLLGTLRIMTKNTITLVIKFRCPRHLAF